MLNTVVLVSGGGTNLQAILDGIEDGRIRNTKISLVISNNPNAYALERAKKKGIEALCIAPGNFADRELYYDAMIETLEQYQPDLIVLAGFLVMIPPKMISRYPNQIINVHPSLIPAFCGVGCYGLKVHQKALERGVKITGATVHYVDEGVDSGPIILQKAVDVLAGDTAEILQKRVMEQAEWVILPQAIDMIARQKEENS